MGWVMAGFRAIAVSAMLVAGMGVGGAALAQDAPKADNSPAALSTAPVVNEDAGVPVFAHDITDRPYKVLGPVSAGVRKATVFSKEADQNKIYRVLWKNAKAMGADAVVNAKYGDSHISAFSWGKTNVTGTAVKFTGPAGAAADAAK